MSGSWNVLGGKKAPDRRSSSSGQVSNSTMLSGGGTRIDQKRPLMSMLSEDGGGSRYSTTEAPANSGVRQSFLSKLTIRSDSKPSSINTIVERNQEPTIQQQHQQHQQQRKATTINKSRESLPLQEGEMVENSELSSLQTPIYGTECDKNNLSNKPKNDLENKDSNSINNTNSKNNKLGKANDYNRGDEGGGGDKDDFKHGNDDEAKSADKNKAESEEEEEEDDDDDNQVIPSWPSKSDASKTINSEFIQHKVYSLKDYSQVASPTATPINQTNQMSKPQQSTTSESRLLKSMSQDRKVKTNTKRLSECLYLSNAAGPPVMSSPNDQSLPSDVSKQQDPSSSGSHKLSSVSQQQSTVGGGSRTITNSSGSSDGLLPNPNHAVLLSESRIDRMRKLFVSPLSLRSSNSSGGFSHGKASAFRGAGHQRLSFQSGASNMLNKPQHLMHAMYRTSEAHHGSGASRRSPMRQDQQANKSFRVYGCPLQMANNIYPITCFGRADIYKQQSVPYVLARLCNYIEENSSHLTHEGIFRVSGNARLMVKLRTLFDHLGDAPLESESVDVATSASMLKMYLRELPEPLIPTRMNYYFITLAKKYSLFLAKDNASSISGYRQPHATSTSVTPSTTTTNTTTTDTSTSRGDIGGQSSKERQRMAFSRDLTKLVRKLPIENYNLLKYLACFLYRISLKQQYNKMCAEALGIVFGPNIFRIRNESYKGLKEQELSNQIMASIISNYRRIFDSEITDPLGNLVESNEAAEEDKLGGDELLMRVLSAATASSIVTSGSPTTSNNKKGPNDGTKQPIESTGSSSPLLDSQAISATTTTATTTPRPSTSKGPPCCPVHCRAHLPESGVTNKDSHIATDSELRVCDLVRNEDDGDDDDDDDDDDEDEGESYTPSSNSDSYCSSMGSETIETSSCAINDDDDDDDYDEDENFGGHHKEAEHLDPASPHSSSESASNTSYTPTSSHTDSDGLPDDEADEADESLYGDSSSFESSLSVGGGAGDGLEKRPQREQQTCRVCERRVSAHLGRIANGEMIPRACDTIQTGASDLQSIGDEPISELPIGGARRRRSDEDPLRPLANSTATRIIEKIPEDEDPAVRIARDDNIGQAAAEGEAEATTETKKSLSSFRPATVAGGGYRRPLTKSTNANKLDFSRRRSSSASSLSRVRQRGSRQQITALTTPTRSHATRAEWRQQPTRSNREATGEHRASRGRHSSSRRPKGRHHSVRRTGGASSVLADDASARAGSGHRGSRDGHVRAGFSSSGARCSRSRSNRLRQQQIMQTPSYHGSSGFGEWRDSLTGGRHWLTEAPGSESYFLLRSFNSDETLLRSFNWRMRPELGVGPNRARRFSGNDAQPNSTCGPPLSRPCDKIFEEERSSCSRVPDGGDLAPAELDQMIHNLPNIPSPPVEQQSFGSSFVSLLDQRLIGFRKSDVSIDEEPTNQRRSHEDCVWIQMRAIKGLIRALRRLQRLASYGGYTANMEQLVRKLAPDEIHGYGDDCMACQVDYLSALDLVKQIESNLVVDSAETDKPTLETIALTKQLDSILCEKINLLKQRQTDFKAIRDHYWKIHAGRPHGQRQATQVSSGMGSIRSKSETGIHGSLGTIGPESTTNTTTTSANDTTTTRLEARELPAPAKEIQASCSSSTSSLADPRRAHGWPTTVRSESGSSRSRQSNCKFGSLCPIEFVFNIEKQLAFKRNQGFRVVKLNEMTMDQLISEKLELQKNLLRYEHWFGRPTSRLEFSLVGHIYERYRAVKMIKLNGDQHAD